MADEIDKARAEQICNGLSKYYKSQQCEYNGLFMTYIDQLIEDDFDDELITAIIDELYEINAVQTQLIEFIEWNETNNHYDFPFSISIQGISKQEQAEFIVEILKRCDKEKDPKFDSIIPEYEFNTVRQIYQTYCPVLYNSGIDKDSVFLQMLTICWKQKWNYLQLLVDDYLRDRIEHIDDAQSWKINKWKNNHKHFLKLRQLKLPKNMPSIEGNDNNEQQTSTTNIKLETVDEFVSKSVFLFRDRLCHELSFKKPIYLINDSLEIVIKYIYAGFMLIGNILSESNATKRALTPFQFDLCIASKPPKSNITNDNDDNNNKDDNSSDDEQDETKEDIDTNYIDSVGDIEAKLKQNKLDYYVEKLKARDREKFKEHQRIFTSLFNKFENKYNSNENNKTYYFHKKRFIALVDRRDLKHDGIDDVYMYLAPNGKYTRDIPNDINMIKYWYFSSSRTCLLPNMEYEEKEIIGIDDGIKNNERESQENKLKDANIHSGFPCCGALLTLSFHVSAQDDIQIYLYHNGKFTRFLPNDIETVLPRLFNMEYGESKNHNTNKEYLDKEDLAQTIKGYDELNSKIKDKRFECFRKLNVS